VRYPMDVKKVAIAGLLIATFALVALSRTLPPATGAPMAIAQASTVATSTAPPLSLVKSLCVPPHTDMSLDQWNYASGYLLCINSDENTGGTALFKRRPNGTFKLIEAVGGALSPADLVSLGVPSLIATPLFQGMHK